MNLSAEFISDVQAQLISRLDLRRNDISGMGEDQLRSLAQGCIRDIVSRQSLGVEVDREQFERQLVQEAVGRGVLEDLLADALPTQVFDRRVS